MTARREHHTAKFGINNAMEAEGLGVIRHALSVDGRVTLVKCFEGARADFVVYADDPAKALGVQLKTTRTVARGSVGSSRYRFTGTSGYDGMALLCVALDSRIRMWMMPGSSTSTSTVAIPTVNQSCRRRYARYETFELDLADDFLKILADPGSDYRLQPADDFMAPSSRNGKAEYLAFKQLQSSLPLSFEPAAVEASHYDCTVDGTKWQLKLACYNKATDRFGATAQKQIGRVGGKRKHSQYDSEDFDWLCVQMPAEHKAAYLFPMSLLLQRRLAGRPDCSIGTLHFYPHRKAHPKTRWTEDYRLDLSDPRRALADYRRIVSRRIFSEGLTCPPPA